MKRVLEMLLCILLLAGCSTKEAMPDPILGTWALVEYTYLNYRTGKMSSGKTDVETWIFKEGGTAYVNGATPLTYTLVGNILTMTYVSSGKEIVYEIEELTTTTLKVYWYFVPGKYQDGMDEWYTFTKMKE